MSAARDVVEVLAKALTDRRDEVHVVESQHKGTTLVELYVGAGELGRVIGKQGRTAAALRTLASAAAGLASPAQTIHRCREQTRRPAPDRQSSRSISLRRSNLAAAPRKKLLLSHGQIA